VLIDALRLSRSRAILAEVPAPNPITARFPMARCDACDRIVLTCVGLDEAGAEHRLCAHCDGELDGQLQWVGAAELEESGYQFGSPVPALKKACGCGSGGRCAVRRN
jgi:hypothetical protein